MICSCGSDTIVKDSRRQAGTQWRKRFCKNCNLTFTTMEQPCEKLPDRKNAAPAVTPKVVVPRPKRERVAKAKKTAQAVRDTTIVAEPYKQTLSARHRLEEIREAKKNKDEDIYGME